MHPLSFIVPIETWLSDNFLNGKLGLSNYVIYRCYTFSLTSICLRGNGAPLKVIIYPPYCFLSL